MESLFIVNPRGKKRRKGKMPAGLRRYWATHRRGGKSKRRRARAVMANPKRRSRRRNPAISVASRRHASRVRKTYAQRKRRRARNPVFSHRRKRRRHSNPFSTRGLTAMLKPAGIGAAGAIAAAIAYGFIAPKLPASLATGFFPTIIKAAAAIGLGMVVGKVMSKQDGQYATIGGLTVVLVGAATPYITSAAPTLPGLSGLAGYGDYIPHRPMGAYSNSLQRGKTTRLGRLGFISPAARVGMGAYMGRGASGGQLSGSGFDGMNDGM